MKTIAATGFALGLAFSMPVFADTKVADEAKPNDLVGVQLKHSDGTNAPALMQREDAKKFHNTSGIEANVVGGDVDQANQHDLDVKNDQNMNGHNMNDQKMNDQKMNEGGM